MGWEPGNEVTLSYSSHDGTVIRKPCMHGMGASKGGDLLALLPAAAGSSVHILQMVGKVWD